MTDRRVWIVAVRSTSGALPRMAGAQAGVTLGSFAPVALGLTIRQTLLRADKVIE